MHVIHKKSESLFKFTFTLYISNLCLLQFLLLYAFFLQSPIRKMTTNMFLKFEINKILDL